MNELAQNPQLHKHIVSHSDLVIGMRVQDDDGNIGTVKECEDIHNIFVYYDNGGSGLHCLVEGCIETKTINGKLIEIPQYDPLYHCG
jgi:hypothetical protein